MDNNGAGFNSNTQGNEIPQDSHGVTADISESPSDSLLSTHDYALGYNECVAPSESSTDGFDSVSKQVLCSSNPSAVVSPIHYTTDIQDQSAISQHISCSDVLSGDDIEKIKTALNVRELKSFKYSALMQFSKEGM